VLYSRRRPNLGKVVLYPREGLATAIRLKVECSTAERRTDDYQSLRLVVISSRNDDLSGWTRVCRPRLQRALPYMIMSFILCRD
jgi:hypothetical protein